MIIAMVKNHKCKINNKYLARKKRHVRIRKKIFGNNNCPRLSASKSSRHIFIQAIDDVNGLTITYASSMEKKVKKINKNKTIKANIVGKLIGLRIQKIGIKKAVFDRCGNKYHGRIKSLVDGIRESGISI